MTTEVESPRSVAELLELDTYQGMTDEEIGSLIQYHIESTKMGAELQAMQAASDAKLADWQARSLATEVALANVLQSNMDAIHASSQNVQPNIRSFVPTEVSNV